jgi:dTDP-4-dehydrorhamnose 3,5-epimerase
VTVEITESPVPGLFVLRMPVHGDNRGWFIENWQREKMVAAGLPDFGPVQHNVSYNHTAGATRGIHAEPWDKLVSVVTGRVFAAWVDLRAGESFGTTFSTEIAPGTAVFVPRGVANSYQTLEDGTAYSYLVNAHWSADAKYTNLNLEDETAAIAWPLPMREVSDKDKNHPRLADVTPVTPRRSVILGADGQLGRALREILPDALALTRADLDLTDPAAYDAVAWQDVDTIYNAAAYTAVDQAETPDGRRTAWAVNVTAVAAMARIATRHGLTLVNVSSDYVFDGTAESHTVDEPLSPLGVYGQTKAAGEVVTSTVPRHYVVRTSWVIGDGSTGGSPPRPSWPPASSTWCGRVPPTASTTSPVAARSRPGPTSPVRCSPRRDATPPTSSASRPRSTGRARTSRRARSTAPSTDLSGREALAGPGVCGGGEAQPVVQTALASLPELDRLDRDAVAAPRGRTDDVALGEDVLDLGDPLLQRLTIGDRVRLR